MSHHVSSGVTVPCLIRSHQVSSGLTMSQHVSSRLSCLIKSCLIMPLHVSLFLFIVIRSYHVLSCLIIYVSSCLIMSLTRSKHVSSCLTMSHHVSSCLIMSHRLPLCLIMSQYVSESCRFFNPVKKVINPYKSHSIMLS